MKHTSLEPSAVEQMIRQSQQAMVFSPFALPLVRSFWEAQEAILGDTEAFSRHWYERRHAATRSALKVANALAGADGSDPAMPLKAIADWQTQSVQRVAEDFKAWFDLCFQVGAHVATAEQDAGATGLKETVARAQAPVETVAAVPV